jgi:hypothetical protein
MGLHCSSHNAEEEEEEEEEEGPVAKVEVGFGAPDACECCPICPAALGVPIPSNDFTSTALVGANQMETKKGEYQTAGCTRDRQQHCAQYAL